ncbi:MAG: hypothetical protein AAF384_15380 [Pseudomonadota bacterium]
MTFLKHFNRVALGLMLFALSFASYAIHSDIEIELDGGKFEVETADGAPPAEVTLGGLKLFETEFGELGNLFATDEPGWEAEDGTGNAGEIVGVEIMANLRRWDGSMFATTGFDEFIRISGASPDIDVSSSSGLGAFSFIDALDGDGGLHTHLDFEIMTTGIGNPTDGAYLLEVAVFGLLADQTTPVYTPSDNFLLAFHLDAGGTFGEEAFESAVESLLPPAPVPVPGAVYLLGSALLFLARGVRGTRAAV